MNYSHPDSNNPTLSAAKSDGDKSRASPGQTALTMATQVTRPNEQSAVGKEAARRASELEELEREATRARENIQRLENAPPADKPEQRRETIAKAKTRLAAIEKRLAGLRMSED